MAARAYWSGQLKISLVSFGIELFSATRSQASIAFHEIDRKTGQRVRHLNVIDGDKPVDRAEIVKGYEYSKGKYITIEPDEIAGLRIPTKKTIEVKRFVDIDELDLSLFESPYFVTPQPKQSSDAFAVVRKALEQTKKAAIGEIAFGGREHLVAIAVAKDASFKGLMAYTLRYAEELRQAKGYMPAAAVGVVDKKQLAMARELIRAYSSPLGLKDFKDDYEAALRDLIESKEKNIPIPAEKNEPKRAKVMNLMDALKRSVSESKRPAPRRQAHTGTHAKSGPVLVKTHARKRKAA